MTELSTPLFAPPFRTTVLEPADVTEESLARIIEAAGLEEEFLDTRRILQIAARIGSGERMFAVQGATVIEYALVNAADANRRCLQHYLQGCTDDTVQIRGLQSRNEGPGYVCTSPVLLLIPPRRWQRGSETYVVQGLAVTKSGTVYRLASMPMSIDDLAAAHPGILGS